jgi:probable O-glycosylation ligase (exosortase A-associated)
VWLGLMNPQCLCWGVAATIPFAEINAIAILIGVVISKESKHISWTPLSVLLAMWWAWMLVTSFNAIADPWFGWNRIWKIMLMTFVTVALLNSRERIHALVWVAVGSIGLYAVKGGIFTILTGGTHRVWGPAGTFIGGNNELGLAMIMTLPLLRYLQLTTVRKWIKHSVAAAMALTVVAILGTQSRGALVGLIAMVAVLAWKSRNRVALILLLVVVGAFAFTLMPESYYSRMDTIQAYEQDQSAMSRINAWWTAWNFALDYPILGGGFGMWTRGLYLQYAPDPSHVYDVHSIYFKALAEHGFVGLFLFLAIGVLTLTGSNRVAAFAAKDKRLLWMRDLASMVFVSVIGYASSGAFLGLTYFDYYYLLVAMAVALTSLMTRFRAEGVPEFATGAKEVGVDGPGLGRLGRRPMAQAPGRRRSLASDIVAWYRRL